jgi:hypothetical protein
VTQTNLDEEEIVRILTLYVQDNNFSLGEAYAPEAVTAVEDRRDFIHGPFQRAFRRIERQEQQSQENQ